MRGLTKSLLALAAAAALGSATPAFPQIPAPNDARPDPNSVFFVIGVQPENTRLGIQEPKIDKSGLAGLFCCSLKAYRPTDGFVIVQAKPDTVYGVASSSEMFGKSIFGYYFEACELATTFQAGPGKVVYLTTITYQPSLVETASFVGVGPANGWLSAAFTQDLEGARAFLKAHYPGLSDNLEQGQYRLTPMYRRCRGLLTKSPPRPTGSGPLPPLPPDAGAAGGAPPY
jgi:hypothetical protein